MATYKDNLYKIEAHLEAAVDQIKATLLADHPDGSGDKLVAVSDKIFEACHMLIDMRTQA